MHGTLRVGLNGGFVRRGEVFLCEGQPTEGQNRAFGAVLRVLTDRQREDDDDDESEAYCDTVNNKEFEYM